MEKIKRQYEGVSENKIGWNERYTVEDLSYERFSQKSKFVPVQSITEENRVDNILPMLTRLDWRLATSYRKGDTIKFLITDLLKEHNQYSPAYVKRAQSNPMKFVYTLQGNYTSEFSENPSCHNRYFYTTGNLYLVLPVEHACLNAENIETLFNSIMYDPNIQYIVTEDYFVAELDFGMHDHLEQGIEGIVTIITAHFRDSEELPSVSKALQKLNLAALIYESVHYYICGESDYEDKPLNKEFQYLQMNHLSLTVNPIQITAILNCLLHNPSIEGSKVTSVQLGFLSENTVQVTLVLNKKNEVYGYHHLTLIMKEITDFLGGIINTQDIQVVIS